jgi:threonine dehydrogenase-like Zn-dependent dehydrogenase
MRAHRRKCKAAVLETFNEPLALREFDVAEPAEGEVLVKLLAAGVCGSDVHMWRGKDPRTPLPLILGHEGVGEIAALGSPRIDIFGEELAVGDMIMWERGIMCGRCYYCVVAKRPALCPERKTYGISVSCKEPPYLRGCYSEYMLLFPVTNLLKISTDLDPKVLVAASCSGATAANAVEQCNVRSGDTVVVQGPGPLGLFAMAFALDAGASTIVVTGTEHDRKRLEVAKALGATETLYTSDMPSESMIQHVREITDGRGADVVIDCTGSPRAMRDGIGMVARGGTYALPGVATPIGEVPVRFFEDVSVKNVRLQGVWVSDTSHLYQAVRLVETGKFPFEKLVTHVLSLEEATEALEATERREAIKAVIVPQA